MRKDSYEELSKKQTQDELHEKETPPSKDQPLFLWIIWFVYKIQQLIVSRFKAVNEMTKKKLCTHKDGPKEKEHKRKKVLLVIAHPDDEAMFFTPALETLIWDTQNRFDVHVLCFTSGNYDGLGETRTRELHKSCKTLGIGGDIEVIRSPTHPNTYQYGDHARILLIDNETEFADHPTKKWSIEAGCKVMQTLQKKYDFDILLTFDKDGVSSHTNHQSVHDIVKCAVDENQALFRHASAYQLITLPIFTKYNTMWWTYMIRMLYHVLGLSPGLTFYAQNYKQTVNAMLAHTSQFVWFRKLFIFFSQYSFVNYLRPL